MDLGEEFNGLYWWLRRVNDKRHCSQWVQQSKLGRRDSAYIVALWSRTSPCGCAYWAIYCYQSFYSSNPAHVVVPIGPYIAIRGFIAATHSFPCYKRFYSSNPFLPQLYELLWQRSIPPSAIMMREFIMFFFFCSIYHLTTYMELFLTKFHSYALLPYFAFYKTRK